MKYIELILENTIVNIGVILIYVSFLNSNIKKYRIAFSIIFLTFFDVCIKLFLENGFIESIIVSIVNIYIITRIKSFKHLLKNYIYYLIIYFFFVGMIFFEVLVFNMDSEKVLSRILLYFLNFAILSLFTRLMWKMWISKIKYYSNTYEVLIKDIGKYKMFLDTGNFLNYYSDLPVIIINEDKYIKKFKKKRKYIQSLKIENYVLKTISGIINFKGYRLKDIKIRKEGEINKEIKEAILLFTDEKIQNDMFDGILPASILIEK